MSKFFPLAAVLLLAAGCAQQNDASTSADARHGRPTALAAGVQSSLATHGLAGIHSAGAPVFASLPDRGTLVGYPETPVVRQDGAYTWHRADLSEAHAVNAIGGTLNFTTPSGESIGFKYERHVEHPSGDWTWIGRMVRGDQSDEAVITFGRQAAFGTISQPGKAPLRLTIQNGASWLIETDPRKVAELHNHATDPVGTDYIDVPQASADEVSGTSPMMAASGSTTTSTAAPVVDLMLAYTSGFAASLGGQSQALTRLNNMVDMTNQAYANSQIPGRVRLVHTMQVNYADNTANSDALSKMTGSDAAFSAVRAARDQYGADLVSLIRKYNNPENGGCGVAWLAGGNTTGATGSINPTTNAKYGYSVVADGQDTTNGRTYFCRQETLAHELGHNMGAQHDRETASRSGTLKYGIHPYSFGYKTGSTAGNFYTIMAYPSGGQTTYRTFSNPRTTFCGGRACGVANQADVARTFETTMVAISQYRASVVTTAPPVSNPQPQPEPQPQPPPQTQPTEQPTGARVPGDFNGDGRSDLLLRNSYQRQIAYWLMSGTSRQGASSGMAEPSGYARVATGDLNGDGRQDIVWARSSDRSLSIWMGTSTGFSQSNVGTYPSGWVIVGAGDVDGDGRSDLLLRNSAQLQLAYWLMNGTTRTGGTLFGEPSGYTRVAEGDFNGDRKLDIVWARSSDRSLLMWTGNGTGFSQAGMGTYPSGWAMVGAGDVDGDGRSDLLLRNSGQLQLAYWLMSGATRTGGTLFGEPSGYARVADGDFNGDGRLDLVWARSSDRHLLMWTGTGTGFSQAAVGNYDSGWVVEKQ